MAIRSGKARVFHDTLGHVGATQKEPILAMNSVDYIVLLQRGTEWGRSKGPCASGCRHIKTPRQGRCSGHLRLVTVRTNGPGNLARRRNAFVIQSVIGTKLVLRTVSC